MKIAVFSSWRGLPQSLSSELFARATQQKLSAGELLFEAGDDGDGCYRLEKGALKVLLRSHQGEERILALLIPHAVVGDLSMIDGLPRSASIVAMSDCELCFVSRKAFLECAKRHPEIYRFLTNLLASRLRETDKTISALAFLTWRGRVARALLELAEVLGTDTKAGETVIHDMISQRELAAMAGVARENVSRALNEWKRLNLINQTDHTLQIRDKFALQREMDW
jgi:CRP/FNR family transcriptional regulator, cyclic AMP receptor protein